MMGYGWHMGGGTGVIGILLGLLFMLAVAAAVVLFVVWLVRMASGGGRMPAHHMGMLSPRDLAAQRYARGEITREQYLQILADLGGGPPAPGA